MKTFVEINKIMWQNEFDKDGNKCAIISCIRYELMTTAEKRGLTYEQADILEFCGLDEKNFSWLCYRTEELYCKTEDPEMTICRLAWAVVKLYNEEKLRYADKWEIYSLAAKYFDQFDEEEE